MGSDPGRLSTLLELFAECSTLGSLEAILTVAPAQLRWALEFDRLTLAVGEETLYSMTRAQRQMSRVAPSDLPDHHEALLRQAMTKRLPCHSVSPAGLSHPLEDDHRVVGALCVTDDGATYSQVDVRIVRYLARFFGGALARFQQAESMREQSLALERADAANLAKDEFFAMLSHELRNPLAPIVTAAEVLLDHEDRGVVEVARVIERQASHLKQLLSDLLDVSRLSNAKLVLERRPTPISAPVRRAVEMCSPMFAEREQHLSVSIPEPDPYVDGDEARLAQIFANLLTNACRHSERDCRASLDVEVEDAEVVITVRDEGRGIPPELLPRIFERFAQGEITRTSSRGGLGLGLTIVKSLVELHDGTVEVESPVEGGGSCFRVRLPSAPRSLKSRHRRSVTPASTETPVCVMIVDDNQDAADLMARALERGGFRTSVAYDAEEALSLLDDQRPDVCLLDIGLPGMDGLELAREIRSRVTDRLCFLVAVTGYGQSRDRARTEEAGFDAHLVKPVDAATVVELIRSRPRA